MTPPPPPQGGPSPPQVTTKDVTSVILRDVKVLAIDQTMQDIDSKPKVGSTATLEVDLPQDAQKLATGDAARQPVAGAAQPHAGRPRPRPRPWAPNQLVEDFEVSPFRAAVLQRSAGHPGRAAGEDRRGAAAPADRAECCASITAPPLPEPGSRCAREAALAASGPGPRPPRRAGGMDAGGPGRRCPRRATGARFRGARSRSTSASRK